jgi:hypothetical protein
MKRSVLLFLSLLFAFALPLLAVSGWDGGPARLQSMGGEQIAVADESTAPDLYNAGFTSSIFTRPAASFIALYPEIDAFIYRTENLSGNISDLQELGIGTGHTTAANDGLQFFLSPDSVLIIKPVLDLAYGKETDYNNYGYRNFLPGGTLSYAQKFGRIAASLTAGYLWEDYFQSENDASRNDTYVEKLAYEISASILPESEGGWTYGLSVGNITTVVPVYMTNFDFSIYNGNASQEFGLLQLFNVSTYSFEDNGATTDENYSDDITTGLKIDLGAANGSLGSSQFDIKAGAVVGMSITEKDKEVVTTKSTGNKVTTNSPDLKIMTDGYGFNGTAALRTEMGSVSFGIKASDIFVAGKTNGGNSWFSQASASAGPSFGTKQCLVPVELFYEEFRTDSKSSTSENEMVSYNFGIRAGNEIAINDSMTARYGIDYASLGAHQLHKTNGVTTFESDATGSNDNPWEMQIGYNAGMGFKSSSSELNIGVRVEPQWDSPKSSDDKSFMLLNGKIFADYRLYL